MRAFLLEEVFVFYLRPRSIFEKFLIAEKITRLDEIGRSTVEYKDTGKILFGVISASTPYEREKFKGLKHEVSHTIVVKLGEIRALVGDVLIQGTRKFLIQAVENPANLGQYYIYFVNERFDLN